MLDWSDGSLTALHFALRYKSDSKQDNGEEDALVYVLEPNRLMETLDALPGTATRETQWEEHLKTNPEDDEDDESRLYLPSRDDNPRDYDLPRIPMLVRFPLFSRRVAAQRSQFIAFGTDPSWLSDEVDRPGSSIRKIIVDAMFSRPLRVELRECGVTESVIFPDLDGLGKEIDQLWLDRHPPS